MDRKHRIRSTALGALIPLSLLAGCQSQPSQAEYAYAPRRSAIASDSLGASVFGSPSTYLASRQDAAGLRQAEVTEPDAR